MGYFASDTFASNAFASNYFRETAVVAAFGGGGGIPRLIEVRRLPLRPKKRKIVVATEVVLDPRAPLPPPPVFPFKRPRDTGPVRFTVSGPPVAPEIAKQLEGFARRLWESLTPERHLTPQSRFLLEVPRTVEIVVEVDEEEIVLPGRPEALLFDRSFVVHVPVVRIGTMPGRDLVVPVSVHFRPERAFTPLDMGPGIVLTPYPFLFVAARPTALPFGRFPVPVTREFILKSEGRDCVIVRTERPKLTPGDHRGVRQWR